MSSDANFDIRPAINISTNTMFRPTGAKFLTVGLWMFFFWGEPAESTGTAFDGWVLTGRGCAFGVACRIRLFGSVKCASDTWIFPGENEQNVEVGIFVGENDLCIFDYICVKIHRDISNGIMLAVNLPPGPSTKVRWSWCARRIATIRYSFGCQQFVGWKKWQSRSWTTCFKQQTHIDITEYIKWW